MAEGNLSTVLAGGSHPVDLEDGRSLPVGETAEIDAMTPYHRALVLDGLLTVIDGPTPRVRQDEKLAEPTTSEEKS